jgi:hypothetical protein
MANRLVYRLLAIRGILGTTFDGLGPVAEMLPRRRRSLGSISDARPITFLPAHSIA